LFSWIMIFNGLRFLLFNSVGGLWSLIRFCLLCFITLRFIVKLQRRLIPMLVPEGSTMNMCKESKRNACTYCWRFHFTFPVSLFKFGRFSSKGNYKRNAFYSLLSNKILNNFYKCKNCIKTNKFLSNYFINSPNL
jgi:hypothetical protein